MSMSMATCSMKRMLNYMDITLWPKNPIYCGHIPHCRCDGCMTVYQEESDMGDHLAIPQRDPPKDVDARVEWVEEHRCDSTGACLGHMPISSPDMPVRVNPDKLEMYHHYIALGKDGKTLYSLYKRHNELNFAGTITDFEPVRFYEHTPGDKEIIEVAVEHCT